MEELEQNYENSNLCCKKKNQLEKKRKVNKLNLD